MDRRRFELSALEVFEVGKPWAEADGDIREAIDFLLFYAQQMRLARSAAIDAARARRRKLSALLAARRRPGHRALEFSDGDSDRHGLGRTRDRQYRHHEAGGAIRRLRRDADGDVRGSRHPAGRPEFSSRQRPRNRPASRRSQGRPHDRVYRLARGRACGFGRALAKHAKASWN